MQNSVKDLAFMTFKCLKEKLEKYNLNALLHYTN